MNHISEPVSKISMYEWYSKNIESIRKMFWKNDKKNHDVHIISPFFIKLE